MAEEKKIDKKPAPPPVKKGDPFTEVVWFIVQILIILFLVNGVISSINSNKIFSRGWEGFTTDGIIKAITRPISSLLNPIGEKIISVKDTTVFDSPDGKKIGSHKLWDKGKILQGPVIIDGVKYWYVDYEKGVDGWVKEGDIAYVEREPTFLEKTILYINSFSFFIRIFSFIFSLFLIFFLFYLLRKLMLLRKESLDKLYPVNKNVDGIEIIKNVKWEKILEHIEMFNQNDWKLAIIEADIMLDDMLSKIGLNGETVGEKLKSVERSDFLTINNAWEAHKIRNQIAHEGGDFILNQREARRVIDLYRSVFEEFGII